MMPTTTPMSYERKIASLIDVAVDENGIHLPIPDLAWALGCRYSQRGVLDAPPATDPENEALVHATLMHLLRTSKIRRLSDRMAILDGLGTNERWRQCTNNVDDAYFLVWLLTSIALEASVQTTTKYAATFCSVLSDWTGVRFVTYPTVNELAKALFGDVWCDLVLSTLEAWEVCDFIASARPPMLPGLLANHLVPADVSLPSLETA